MPRWSSLLRTLLLLLLAAAALPLPLPGPARAQDPLDARAASPQGAVTLPLAQWQQVLAELEAAAVRPTSPVPVLQVDRSVVGSFRRGVLAATLDTRFEVAAAAGHVRVPVLDADTSIRRVLLDGRETSLLREGDMYTVGVDGGGAHRVVVEFVQGHEDDRFARRLAFRLPASGPTRVEVQVPELDIDASLAQGAITSVQAVGGGTRIVGHLDGRGTLDLSWKRRLHQAEAGVEPGAVPVRSEARLDALFTLHEALVRGVVVVDLSVLEGEADRLDLVVPAEVEVVDVTGDAVLQWRTEQGRTDGQPDGTGRLSILLRYLVDDQAQVRVHFQFPVDLAGVAPAAGAPAGGAPAAGAPVVLRLPRPVDGVPTEGAIGVQGPAGLQVEVDSAGGAEALTLRDLPPELTELTQSPLLLGFRFARAPAEAVPEIGLSLLRTEEVELTSTIVDDLQASTVLLEDGTEITKLRLRLRNNTRQYLAATLPAGAVLTHAFIDGQGLRPALSDPARPEALLLPLRQSERMDGQGLTYQVQPGDTLSGIAAAFLSGPGQWTELLAANADQLGSAWDLEPGQVLRIPSAGSGSLRESSFVIELAYKVQGEGLGPLGGRRVTLPELDVDTVALTWHLYLPDALEPLRFRANLTQTSNIRYDPFRRLRHFLGDALRIRSAWAGGGEYSSILSQRKAIYREENLRRQGGQEVTSSFPYVGRRTAFSRILSGRERPEIGVLYVDRDALPPLRVGALLAGFGLLSWALRAPADRRRWLLGALGLSVVLVLAHLVMGMHRRLLWGLDLALLLDLARTHGGALLRVLGGRLSSPGALLDALSWRNLAAILTLALGLLVLGTFPLLLSSVAFVALVALRRAL